MVIKIFDDKFYENFNNIHFVAIGGKGMSALAKLVLNTTKYTVTGSDIYKNQEVKNFIKDGIEVNIGHSKDNIKQNSIIIYSTAISDNNPEIKIAKRMGLPILHRTDMILHIIKNNNLKLIGVLGAHGKTTTSCLITHVLNCASIRPNYILGDTMFNTNKNAELTGSEFLVLELDEGDNSFMKFDCDYSIITNIDYEHLEYYNGSIDVLNDRFKNFASRSKNLFWCGDDPLLDFENGEKYGFNNYNDVRITKNSIDNKCQIYNFFKDKEYNDIKIPLLGKHNILNSVAVFNLCLEIGVSENVIKEAFMHFKGINDRMNKMPDYKNVEIYYDFAHHPTEVKATLEGFRQVNQEKKILALFQPYKFSRTFYSLGLWKDIFNDVDGCIMTDTFVAFEDPTLYNVNEMTAFTEINHGNKHFVPIKKLKSYFKENLEDYDLFILMGGATKKLIYPILEELISKI